jgi:hypothetical protein
MKVYKLTDQCYNTYKKTQWGFNVTHTLELIPDLMDMNKPLCSKYWIHAYNDPYIALFRNPADAAIANPIIWEAEADDRYIKMEELKLGTKKLTTITIVNVEVSLVQRIAFAILCAKKVYGNKKWNIWADKWLMNVDRTHAAAYAVANAVATNAAANAAAYAVAYAVAYAADAANAAAANADAANVNTLHDKIDFIALAHKAIHYV